MIRANKNNNKKIEGTEIKALGPTLNPGEDRGLCQGDQAAGLA